MSTPQPENKLVVLLTLARAIALSGKPEGESINGFCGRDTVSRTFGDFTYTADPNTAAVEVYFDGYQEGKKVGDPLVSLWDDGEICRAHHYRYNWETELKKHLQETIG